MSRDIETNWTLLKLTCELLEDRTILKDFLEEISHCLVEKDIKTRYETPILINPTDQPPEFLGENRIRDLASGRPNLPIDLYHNESLYCLEKVPPTYSQQSRLYYYRCGLGRVFKFESANTNQASVDDCQRGEICSEHAQSVRKPCVIVISENNEETVEAQLAACSKMQQPVEVFYIAMILNFIPMDPLPCDPGNLGRFGMRFPPPFPKPDQHSDLVFQDNAVVTLYGCNFQVKHLDIIVKSLESCANLDRLNLFACGYIPSRIFTNLHKMTNLRYLMVRNCVISWETCQMLAAQIKHLIRLEHVDFSYLRVEGVYLFVAIIAASLCHLKSLKVVKLQGCQFLRDNCLQLMEGLASCPLEKLDLTSNYPEGNFIEIQRSSEVKFEQLTHLQLNHCNISADDIISIAQMIQENRFPHLQEIEMGNRSMSGRMDALEELLKTCDRKRLSQKCDVIVVETSLSDHVKGKGYECLKYHDWFLIPDEMGIIHEAIPLYENLQDFHASRNAGRVLNIISSAKTLGPFYN